MRSVESLTSTMAVQDALHNNESASIWGAIANSIYDVWVEVVVIAVVIYIYLRFAGSSPAFFRRIVATPKVDTLKQGSGDGKLGKLQHDGKRSQQSRGGRADVRAFVASVVKNREPEGTELQQYEVYVRNQHVDLRHQISDPQTARVFYSKLIARGVEAVVDLSHQSGASAKATTSRFLTDMRIFGFQRDHEFYGNILKLHATSNLFTDVLWLNDVMAADSVSLDRAMYGYLLTAAVSCGQDQKAVAFFREISKMGVVPMRTYMTILRVYSKRQDWRGALEVLHSLEKSEGSPDALVLNTVLGLCVSCTDVVVAEDLLAQWPSSSDVVSCNIVLKGYAQQANSGKAQQLLTRMLHAGPAPGVITFNTVLDCVVRHLQQASEDKRYGAHSDLASVSQQIWWLLDKMVELGLGPDRYTCSSLVKSLQLTGCCAHDVGRTIDLLRKLGPEGLQATSDNSGSNTDDAGSRRGSRRVQEMMFNSLLGACVKSQDLDRLVDVFALMSSFAVEVSQATYGTLIKTLGQSGRIAHCHEVWKGMLRAEVKPTVVTLWTYIDACVRNHHVATAEEVYGMMEKMGVKPNGAIYTSMIRGYANSKRPHKSLEVYQHMRREGVEATAVTYNSVLDIMARQLIDVTQLQGVVDDMRAASVSPDVITYSILIKGSCNGGDLVRALSFFRELRSQGLTFDEVAFNTLLLACSKAERLEAAEEVLAEMRAVGVAPTQVTISILVKMYGKAKMLDKAIELSNMVEREFGMKPNVHVYTCLIQACVRNRQTRKSWELFGSMLCSSVAPDAVTYGAVIQGCIYTSKFEEAMALVRHAYAVDRNKVCILKSLGMMDPCHSGKRLAREHALPLQPDVMKALLSALKRKSQTSQVVELQALIDRHGVSRS